MAGDLAPNALRLSDSPRIISEIPIRGLMILWTNG